MKVSFINYIKNLGVLKDGVLFPHMKKETYKEGVFVKFLEIETISVCGRF
jgi:hypothetical protein